MVKGKSCPLGNPYNPFSTFSHNIIETTHLQSKLLHIQAATFFYYNIHWNTSSTARLGLSSLNGIKANRRAWGNTHCHAHILPAAGYFLPGQKED